MPLIQVKLIEGVFDATEKEAIIEKLTDAMVSVEGEAMRPVTWVTIEEVASGEWGIARQGPAHRRRRRHALHRAVAETHLGVRAAQSGADRRRGGNTATSSASSEPANI